MRIPLAHLSYSDVNPFLLIDRQDEVKELFEGLERFITQHHDRPTGHTVTVVGHKGVGKSIVTRRVLADLRHDYSAQCLVLEVDCRARRSWRDVLADICTQLRDELHTMQETLQQPVPDYALPAASLMRDVARMDKVTRTDLHQASLRFTSKKKLSAAIELRKAFQIEAELDITVEKVDQSALTGLLVLDEDRVNRMFMALVTDLFKDGWKVVLFLDNLDELDHRPENPGAINAVRREVEGILKLHRAPMALVLNMRTYFSGVLSRELPATQVIEALSPEYLLQALDKRLEAEDAATRAAFAAPEVVEELGWLATRCSTPLEFLWWVQNRAISGTLSPAERERGCKRLMRSAYPNFEWEEVMSVVRAFDGSATRRVSRGALTERLGGDAWAVDRAMEAQMVLPVDFWRPEMLTLDARLHPLLALQS